MTTGGAASGAAPRKWAAAPIIIGVDDGAANRLDADADEALMLAYAAGDAQAFARLYDRHERPVYRFLLRSLGNAAPAEELLQEVWLAVVRNAAGYEPRARFTTWLYGIARSRLIDHWRAQRQLVSLDEPAANDPDDAPALIDGVAADEQSQPEVRALGRAQAQALVAAVHQLPAPQREAFLLHAEAGMTLEEIAQLTGVGMETAKSRLRYAYARLRMLLQQWHDR